MRDDVKIGDQCRLQDDGNIGGVEQLDGVSVVLAAVACRLDGKVHSEALGGEKKKARKKSESKYLAKTINLTCFSGLYVQLCVLK